MATTGTVPAWAAGAWAAWALALCRCARAAWPVADEGVAAGPVADEEGEGAAWWVAGDEAAAGPDAAEEDARALWPVAEDEDAAGPEADEEDASAAWRVASDEASSGTTWTLDLRRTTACKATWSLRAGHTPVSRRISAHSADSPSPASWRKTRSYRAVDEPLHQVQSSTPGGEDQASRQPSLCKSLSSPTRRFKSPAKTQSWPCSSHSCERLIWRSWLSLASRSTSREPDSACVFKMVQPLQRVVIRWRPFADAGNGNDVVLSEPCLITVTLK